MDKKTILRSLEVLGFVEETTDVLVCEINKHKIIVNIDPVNISNSRINYGSIKVCHKGICNFTKDEYLVQLECVIRLLKKGYDPKQIELEKQYPLGHADKGRLDVLLKKRGKAWAMIECKTHGSEYNDERSKMLKSGIRYNKLRKLN